MLLPGPVPRAQRNGAVNPYAVHDHGQPACQGYDRLFNPAAAWRSARPQALSRRTTSSGSTSTARSGEFLTSSLMRASNFTVPTIPTLRPKLRSDRSAFPHRERRPRCPRACRFPHYRCTLKSEARPAVTVAAGRSWSGRRRKSARHRPASRMRTPARDRSGSCQIVSQRQFVLTRLRGANVARFSPNATRHCFC